MIELAVRKVGHTTPWCLVCVKKCGSPDLMVCETCRGHIAVSYRCPECNAVGRYFGYDVPEACRKCGYIWPDLDLLANEVNERIFFHLEP